MEEADGSILSYTAWHDKKNEQSLLSRLTTVPDTGCMVYTGPMFPNGYGQFAGSKMSSIGRQAYAHRAAYLMWKGPIPDGHHIDHLCRNRACCNPAHLEAVTPRENMLRGDSPASANSKKTHCKNGHPLSGDNLLLSYGRRGSRQRACRTCHNASMMATRAKKRGVDRKM